MKKTSMLIIIIALFSFNSISQNIETISQFNKIFSDVNCRIGGYSNIITKISFNEQTNIVSIKGTNKNVFGSIIADVYVTFDLTKIKKPNYSSDIDYNYCYIKSASVDCIHKKIIARQGYEHEADEEKSIKDKIGIETGSNSYNKRLLELLTLLYESNVGSGSKNLSPLLTIKNLKLIDINGNNSLDNDETVILNFTIFNSGNIKSENISVIINELNNIKGLVFEKITNIALIEANQSRIVDVKISTNSLAESANAIFQLSVKDNLKEYSNPVKVQIPVSISSKKIISFGELADVDVNIPKSSITNSNTYCLIIGNEKYKNSNSANKISDVTYAENDADVFYKYMTSTLGIPIKNITLLKNGTAIEIKQGLNKLSSISEVLNGQNNIIFYYAGHGLPNELSKEQILIPTDVTSVNLENGIKISDIVNQLNKGNPQHVFIFFDACFSGGVRTEQLTSNSRGVRIVPKETNLTSISNTVIFSSSSDTESSYAYPEKKHGLFTYYLLKKLKDTKGSVTLLELDNYLQKEVKLNSILINNYQQTPYVKVSPDLQNSWMNLKLK